MTSEMPVRSAFEKPYIDHLYIDLGKSNLGTPVKPSTISSIRISILTR